MSSNPRLWGTNAMSRHGASQYQDDWYDRADGMPYELEKFPTHPCTTSMWDWGSYWWPRTEHSMSWDNKYVDKKNALLKNKPVIDCSRPFNGLSREDQANRYGTNWGPYGIMNSMAHFHQEPEKVPYTTTYSTRDCVTMWWGFLNMFTPQYWVQKYMMQGGQAPGNPRTMWAHRITWIARFWRLQGAILIGAGGFFCSYEFMYTHVPYFRIRDPSPNGWKRNWQAGQTTYMARTVACVFPTIALAFYNGHTRRSWLYTWFFWACQMQYELWRGNLTANGLIWKQQHSTHEIFERDWGSLQPSSKRKNDKETQMPLHYKSFKNYKRWETMQRPGDGVDFMDIPFHVSSTTWKNDSFNWSKAEQGWNPRPYRCANDTWDEPKPMSPDVLAGRYQDRGTGTAKNYGYNNRVLTGAHYNV